MTPALEPLFDPDADFAALAAASGSFLRDQGLGPLADALPHIPSDAGLPGPEFPFRLVLPPTSLQAVHVAAMVQALAATPLKGIDEAEQYTEPYAPSPQELAAIENRARPCGAYLLSLDPEDFAQDRRGLTAPAVRKWLEAAGCHSLTALEYLILQRIFLDHYGDHRFDYYGASVDDTRWMWLPDSVLGDTTFMGYWNPGRSRVELSACKTGSKNPRKGVYVTRILPLP